MNILYALIAFAVTMIVMTTLVVALVELVFELRSMRGRHMRYMLGAVFDEYLWPQFGKLVGPPEDPALRSDASKPKVEEELRQPADGSLLVKFGLYLDVIRNTKAFFQPEQKWRLRPSPVWGILFWLILAIFAFIFFDAIFIFIVATVLIAYFIDRSRESERDNFSIWHDLEADKIDQMNTLDGLYEQLKQQDLAPSEREQAHSDLLAFIAANPEASDLYQKIAHRRQFIDEIVNVAKAQAADPARAKAEKQSQLNVVEFAAYLGRTQFGEAIRKVSCMQIEDAKSKAEEMLAKLLTDMARRYDSLSEQSTVNYRVLTRRWSVWLAFVVALIANVDAIYLFNAYVADPALAKKVEETYADRVAAMSVLEAELVERLEKKAEQDRQNKSVDGTAKPLTPEQKKAQDEQDIEALKKRYEEFQNQTKATLAELTELGVPVGWEVFPWCGNEPEILVSKDQTGELAYAHPDPRCKAMVLAAADAELKPSPDGNKKPQQKGTEEKKTPETATVQISFKGLMSKLEAEPSTGCKGTQSGATSNTGQFSLCKVFEESWENIAAHWDAAWAWGELRWPHGLRSWAFGVLLAGLLIGLGGPFWYDIYKKLSAVAQISRSLGLRAKQPTEDTEKPKAQQTAHVARDVTDAFKTSQEVTTQVKQFKNVKEGFAFQAKLTETAEEDEGVDDDGIRRELDRQGNPI